MAEGLKIGELAQATSCAIGTIRYYERERLLPKPVRSQGNFRLYDRTHVARLSFIRHCRSLDMTLQEIRLLLRFRDAPERNCAEVNKLLDEHVGHVAERIAELKALEKQLKSLRRLCQKVQTTKDCGILNELTHRSTSEKKRTGHVNGTHARRSAR